MDTVYDFPLTGKMTYEKIEKAHRRLMEIAVTLRDILEEAGIPYIIIFGSLIGALRHKGFIPWDLDFDMAVPDEYYEKAAAAIAGKKPEWIVVASRETDPNYCAYWNKYMDKSSRMSCTMFEKDNLFRHNGLHVDLYSLKSTNEANYQLDLYEDNKDYYSLLLRRGLMDKEAYDKVMAEQGSNVEGLTRNNEAEDEYYFLKFFKTKKNNLFPAKEYIFEGERFYGPADYDATLRGCYYTGDYMTPPPYEKRDMKMDDIEFYDET